MGWQVDTYIVCVQLMICGAMWEAQGWGPGGGGSETLGEGISKPVGCTVGYRVKLDTRVRRGERGGGATVQFVVSRLVLV